MESEWLSHSQLVDIFKNEDHANSFIKWAANVQLMKYCSKRQCRVYFFTRRLERRRKRRGRAGKRAHKLP